MFWSKIWFFLVAIAATVCLTVALVIPRPAERRSFSDENRRIRDACSVANILLTENARLRIGLALDFSVAKGVDAILAKSSRSKVITSEQNRTARDAAHGLINGVEGSIQPDFVIVLDNRGRVVARATGASGVAGVDTAEFGDSLVGYSLVNESLAGFMRDDLWVIEGALYRMAAAPIVSNGYYVGVVLLGHDIDGTFAETIARQLGVKMSFYAGERAVANSDPQVQIHNDIVQGVRSRESVGARVEDCALDPMMVQLNAQKSYLVAAARLPGEAGEVQGAFYSIFAERPTAIGIGAIKKDDLSFGSFPWIRVAGLFLLIIGIGFGAMIWETDRPLRRLVDDAIDLSKGEIERLKEDRHRGKFGSIARSINIQLDKQEQATKAAKSDLDQLLGPASDAGIGTFDASGASALPKVGPGTSLEAFAAPPPSEFKFADAPAPVNKAEFEFSLPAPPSTGLTASPPPLASKGKSAPTDERVAPAPISIPGSQGRPLKTQASFDSESTVISDPSQELLSAAGAEEGEGVFRKVFDEFVALKKKCGETADNLNFDKFARKLEKNKASLMAKHGCQDVRFQVYVKSGKAALRATPIKM